MGQTMVKQLLKGLGAMVVVLWSVGEFGVLPAVVVLYIYVRLTGMKTYHDGGL